ncbi:MULTISPECIES: cell division protein FtsL [Marinomonas]|uniref:Cell division protein FtsL n=1 Tax=Marinomonas aquiplantarum TaxID=491951 RepID=A0A366CXN1_9GAMM|nr:MULTISPECIES: cell division protein FtsL [Marinomonas]KZN15404.1 S-adenosyl-methyltransferase [Marinomonas sp. TW1]RBO81979.1 cell division protein FtsL [Marinomonas aquiplantarum]
MIKSRFTPWIYLSGVVVLTLVSMAVVVQVYEFRQDFSYLQKLKQEEVDFEVKWGQLLLEQSALTQPSRLEQTAIKDLNMHAPSQDELIIVKP